MASGSKRSRKSTGKAKMSSQPEQPPIFNYKDGSFLWFPTKQLLHRFKTSFEKRDILPPRFLPMSNLPILHSNDLLQHLQTCEMSNFVSFQTSFISKPLIRAFYSNMVLDEESNALFTSINGKDIYLSEEVLNTISSLPCTGQNTNTYIGTDGNPFNEILFLGEIGLTNFISHPGRRPSVTKQMIPMYRTLLYLLTRIIKPRKHSHTTMTKEDIRLMHAIVNHAQINWCEFILSHMSEAATDQNKPLPYATLIMQILDHYGIDTSAAPKTKATKIWEVCPTSFRMQEEEGAAPPRQRQQPDQVTLNLIYEKLNQMSLEMHGYFDSIGYTGYKDPTSHIGEPSQGGEGENVGMEEDEQAEDSDEEDSF